MTGTRIRALALCACGSLALACGAGGGGSDNRGPTAPTGGTPTGNGCQFAVSGAVSGTAYPCFSGYPYVLKVAGKDQTSFMVLGQGHVGEANAGGIGIGINLLGTPAVGTYTYSSAPSETETWAVSFSLVAPGSTTSQDWKAGGGPEPAWTGGTCTLTFTSVGAPLDAGPDQTFPVHGTLHATLSADTTTGASGQVTLDLTF